MRFDGDGFDGSLDFFDLPFSELPSLVATAFLVFGFDLGLGNEDSSSSDEESSITSS